MSATLLDRVPVEEIRAEARDIQFGRTVLTVLVGVLFALGWVVGKAWRSVAWSFAAVKVGFQAGRTPRASDGGG
jgi:hypothetical protein